jgi:hypothetical protein
MHVQTMDRGAIESDPPAGIRRMQVGTVPIFSKQASLRTLPTVADMV